MNAAVMAMEFSVDTYVSVKPEGKRARASALIYAENRLIPWAKWAREHRDKLGYPTISLLYKAMRQKAVRITADKVRQLTANGHETLSFRPLSVGEVPEAIAEVDLVVADLPENLHDVIVADFFTYGSIEVRAAQTRWKLARYSQLLEAAKYSVYAGLIARSSRNDL